MVASLYLVCLPPRTLSWCWPVLQQPVPSLTQTLAVCSNQYQVDRGNQLCKEAGLNKCKLVKAPLPRSPREPCYPRSRDGMYGASVLSRMLGWRCLAHKTQRAAAMLRVKGHTAWSQADFHHTGIEDESFDHCYSIEACCHSPDRKDVYGEVP